MVRQVKNYYINAPAGSGKTQFIENKVNHILSINPYTRILCITYTNRASDEMRSRIISENVEVSTIHSFINKFMTPFFKLPQIIEYFTDVYENDIKGLLLKDEGKYIESYKEKLQLDEYVEISIDLIKQNISHIYYNELNYNQVLYGGISHSDLLKFAFKILVKFPVINRKLGNLYDYIFIDEVQDTSTEILEFIYSANIDSNTKLYFLGDKMQEIFEAYDGEFENKFQDMDKEETRNFNFNYRSSPEIVEVLESLYKSHNKPHQKAYNPETGLKPKIVICEDIKRESNSQKYNDFLKLKLKVKQLFEHESDELNLTDLYDEYIKIYSHQSKYNIKDVLLPKEEKSIDIIIRFIFLILNLVEKFRQKNFGLVIQSIKEARYIQKGKSLNIFELNNIVINKHRDKKSFNSKLEEISRYIESDNQITLKEFINNLETLTIISKEFALALYNLADENDYSDYSEAYKNILNFPLFKFKNLWDLNKSNNVSTQHGVKGEGHDKVLFICEDSNRIPITSMYYFFNFFSNFPDLSFEEFQAFYYEYTKEMFKLEATIGTKIYYLNGRIKEKHIEDLKTFYNLFKDNTYFSWFNTEKQVINCQTTIKDIKALLRKSKIQGVLQAYKLFYVGCSRAKRELVVLVEKEKLESFMEEFVTCFSTSGFDIEYQGLRI